ncbi:MAG: LysR family transcriptional regulator [Acidimicrobiia bacterium]|nr:LysR family transcriptional regulator [Acidimicrobiia bacterium]MCY4457650.1 LysR family transcriptional regulator [Acidimicrobiaceae bacterium]
MASIKSGYGTISANGEGTETQTVQNETVQNETVQNETAQRQVTLRELENFVSVAKHASLTLGAEAVGITQPAASASLKNLEDTLRTNLLVRRRGHGVSLTPEGELLLAEAQSLLDRASDLTAVMHDAVSLRAGRVLLGSLISAAPIVMPSAVRSFVTKNPQIEVEIRTGSQDELLNWLRTGAIHAAVTYDIELGRDVRFFKIIDAVPHLLLPASHPLAGAEEATLEEVADDNYILLDLPLSREYFTSFFLAAGVPYQPTRRHADLSLVRSLVGNDFGYSLVNLLPATDVAQDGSRVAYVRLRTPVPPRALGLVERVEGSHPRAVEAFLNHARSSLALPRQSTSPHGGSHG